MVLLCLWTTLHSENYCSICICVKVLCCIGGNRRKSCRSSWRRRRNKGRRQSKKPHLRGQPQRLLLPSMDHPLLLLRMPPKVSSQRVILRLDVWCYGASTGVNGGFLLERKVTCAFCFLLELVKQLNECRFKLKKAEQDITTLDGNVCTVVFWCSLMFTGYALKLCNF